MHSRSICGAGKFPWWHRLIVFYRRENEGIERDMRVGKAVIFPTLQRCRALGGAQEMAISAWREDLIRLGLLLVGRISNYLGLNFLLRGNMSYLTVDPLSRCTDIQPVVDWLLHRAIDVSQTSFGNVQLMSWTSRLS
jgi:hypothetical protein